MTNEEIIKELSGKTVLEINELVKALEEAWGVSAAAAVAVAGPAAGGAAAAEGERSGELDDGPEAVVALGCVQRRFIAADAEHRGETAAVCADDLVVQVPGADAEGLCGVRCAKGDGYGLGAAHCRHDFFFNEVDNLGISHSTQNYEKNFAVHKNRLIFAVPMRK